MTARHPGLYYDATLDLWVASVDLPRGADGRRRQVRRTSRDRGVAERKLRELRAEIAAGQVTSTSTPTVGAWMEYWLDRIAAQRVSPKTLGGYRSSVKQSIIPTIGSIRLNRLKPGDVRRMHDHIVEGRGRSAATAQQAHAALSSALADAQIEGHIQRNVAALVQAPRTGPSTRRALTVPEAQAVLHTVADDRLGARWALALLLGLRRGEAIGLSLEQVQPDRLTVSWQLARLKMRHGCRRGEPRNGKWPCGRTRGGSCPSAVADVRRPDYEYRQLEGGLHLVRPKSASGWRVLPLPPGVDEIVARRVEAAAAERNPHGLLFTRDSGEDGLLAGRPISPEQDTDAWKAIAARAGITRKGTLHEARHTTATLLQAAGVDQSTRIEILGHSSITTTRAYEHVDVELRRDALARLAGNLGLNKTAPTPQLAIASPRAATTCAPDLAVVTAGWQGDTGKAAAAIEQYSELGAQAIIILGGLGALRPGKSGRVYDQALTYLADEHDIDLLLIDGPGDPIPRLQQLPDTGWRAMLPRVHWAPRGHTWNWHGHPITALGGGEGSGGLPGITRWVDHEALTEADVGMAVSAGTGGVLLTATQPGHESASARLVTQAVERMQPALTLHPAHTPLLWDVIANHTHPLTV